MQWVSSNSLLAPESRKRWFRVGCPLLGVEQNSASLEPEGRGSREGSLGLPPWRDGGTEEGMNLGFIPAPEPGLYPNDPRLSGSESVKRQQGIVLLVTLCLAVTGPWMNYLAPLSFSFLFSFFFLFPFPSLFFFLFLGLKKS